MEWYLKCFYRWIKLVVLLFGSHVPLNRAYWVDAKGFKWSSNEIFQPQQSCNLSLLLHQSRNRICFWNRSIVWSRVFTQDHTRNGKARGEMTHIICDFLSQVGLCDEDLGDFLTGSIKHTGHQWVFIVPQPGSLWEVKDKENSWSLSNKNSLLHYFSLCHHSEISDSPPDSCTI